MSGLDFFFDLNRDGHVSAGEAMFVVGSHLENYRAIAEDEARYEREASRRTSIDDSFDYSSYSSFSTNDGIDFEDTYDNLDFSYDDDENDFRDYDQEADDIRLSLMIKGVPEDEIRCYNCKHWSKEYDFFLRSDACDVWHKLEKKMDSLDCELYISDMPPSDDEDICYKFKLKNKIKKEYGL